jgi:hypothetical protein
MERFDKLRITPASIAIQSSHLEVRFPVNPHIMLAKPLYSLVFDGLQVAGYRYLPFIHLDIPLACGNRGGLPESRIARQNDSVALWHIRRQQPWPGLFYNVSNHTVTSAGFSVRGWINLGPSKTV